MKFGRQRGRNLAQVGKLIGQSEKRNTHHAAMDALENRVMLALPVAQNDAFTTLAPVPIHEPSPGVTVNDFDLDGDAYQVELTSDVSNGQLALNSDGSFDYTPNSGFVGTDSFKYRLVTTPDPVKTFTIDRARSNGAATITLHTPLGTRSDTDSSSVTGFMVADINPESAPFANIHINALEASMADATSFDFDFGFLVGQFHANAAADAIHVQLLQPGDPSNVDGVGNFNQINNLLRLYGSADLSCGGLVCGLAAIPPNAVFDTTAYQDFAGTVTQAGNTITLTFPITFAGTFEIATDVTADVVVNGTVVATAQAGPEASTEATVTINVRDHIVAAGEYFHAVEDHALSIGPDLSLIVEPLLPAGSIWRYLDDGSNQGTAWRATGFNDAAWKIGPAQLGYGEGDEATVVSYGPNASLKYITTYFRRVITLERADDIADLFINLRRDDGANVYVNGTRIINDGLPEEPAFDQLATAAGDDGQTFNPFIRTAPLVAGKNVIAVEVHQTLRDSSDISFDMEIYARRLRNGLLVNDSDYFTHTTKPLAVVNPSHGNLALADDGSFVVTPSANYTGADRFQYMVADAADPMPVAPRATWKYLDDGSDQGTAWKDEFFNDATWASGQAHLGYGDGDEQTVVSFGNDATNKHITTYFRHSFEIPDASIYTEPVLNVIRDDGVAIYLNGTRVGLNNLADGAAFNTPAGPAIGGNDEFTPVTFAIPAGLLHNGTNVLAAEIHQSAGNSSDISFDAWLTQETTSKVAQVNILYEPREDAPVADVDSYNATVGVELNVDAANGVLNGDTDPENSAFHAQVVTNPAHGTLTLNADGSFKYTGNSAGPDSFTYRAVQNSPSSLVPTNATWRILDDGSDQGTAWRGAGFDDSGWAIGVGQFGYGENDEATLVRYGSDPNNRRVTTYFRKEFDIADPAQVIDLAIKYKRDDGVNIYLNGTRLSLVNGNLAADVAFNFRGANPADDGQTLFTESISPALLVAGKNYITAEVHQTTANSSDVTFELELVGTLASTPATVNINVESTVGPLVLDGTGIDDHWFVGIYDAGLNYHIWHNTNPASDPPTLIRAVANVTAMTFNGLAGDDSLTILTALPLVPTFDGGVGLSALNVEAGSVAYSTDLATGSDNLSITVTNDAAVTFSASQHLASLTVGSTAHVTLTANGGQFIHTSALNIGNLATLDLADNDLILQSTSVDRENALATLTAYIASARAGGTWTGSGLTSSIAAVPASGGLTGLGVIINDADGSPLHTTFNGESVDTNSLLVKYTWNGDSDESGQTDADDYFKIDSGFAAGLAGWINGDYDYSGGVDADDYFLIDSAFAGQVGVLAAPARSAAMARSAASAVASPARPHHRPRLKTESRPIVKTVTDILH